VARERFAGHPRGKRLRRCFRVAAKTHGNRLDEAQHARIRIDLASVQTNIIVFHVAEGAPSAPDVAARARERGVLVFALGPTLIRAVTHLDVTREQCERAAEVLCELAEAER